MGSEQTSDAPQQMCDMMGLKEPSKPNVNHNFRPYAPLGGNIDPNTIPKGQNTMAKYVEENERIKRDYATYLRHAKGPEDALFPKARVGVVAGQGSPTWAWRAKGFPTRPS